MTKSTLTLREQVGQVLVVGFDGTSMSAALASLLDDVKPAGVILFARNISAAPQTHQLLTDCRARASTPLLACVDLEGGRVDRFRNVFGPAPSPAEVFATGDRSLFRRHGKLIGENCRSLGFNVDLAPVVDLALEASRTVMSSRAVSANPKEVISYAREFLAGLASAGVIGAAKHFPGLGEANLDTHHELPSVKKSWKKLWEEDLVPYRAMRRELPMVLVGHANYPLVTKDSAPASLSKKWIAEVLRKKIGYRGLVVSDDLEMGGVLAAGEIEHAVVEHVRAGGDLCLICHQEEFVRRGQEALIRECERNRRFAARIADSTARVLAFKRKSVELRKKTAALSPDKVAKLSRQLWEFGERVRLEGMAQA